MYRPRYSCARMLRCRAKYVVSKQVQATLVTSTQVACTCYTATDDKRYILGSLSLTCKYYAHRIHVISRCQRQQRGWWQYLVALFSVRHSFQQRSRFDFEKQSRLAELLQPGKERTCPFEDYVNAEMLTSANRPQRIQAQAYTRIARTMCIHQLCCARLHLLCQGIDVTVTQRRCVILVTVEFHHVFLLSANQKSCDPFLSQPEKAKRWNSTTWPNLTASTGGGVL